MSKKRLFVLVLPFAILFSLLTYEVTASSSSKDNVNLMIVAHPDDESIFAGNEILNNSYHIVCITNGNNEVRKQEFEKMLEVTGNTGVMLSYPDKTNGERDDWSIVKKDIEEELNSIIASREWGKIVTHNLKGEYGHIQHKKTNEIVTTLVKQQNKEDQLYYFGDYFKAKNEAGHTKTLNKEQSKEKVKLLTVYSSQLKTVNKLQHILDYEEIVPYQK